MPEHYRVIVAGEAFDNLTDILDFAAEVSSQSATHLIEKLWEATQSLEQFPKRYPVYQSRKRPDMTVRTMRVPPFIVYYRVVDESRTVRVLTVRHGARRQPRRF